MSAEIIIPEKFKPLFEIDRAKELSKDKSLKPKERKYYAELSKVNIVICTGGRYGSKSFSVGMAACDWSANYGHKILYTRYTLKSTEDSITPEFEEKIDLLNYGNWYNVKKDRIDCTHNDSEIVFKGIKTSSGNQTANLKSIKGFSRWIYDEGEEHPDHPSWDKIRLSIRHLELKNLCVLILNPTTKTHWIYKKFFIENGVKAGFNGIRNGVLYIHTTYKDVPEEYIPDDILNEYKEGKKMYDEYEALEDKSKSTAQLKAKWKWYKTVILGGWLDRAEGVVYENWEPRPFPDKVQPVYGLDYGFSVGHETALIATHIDHALKRIYLKELCYTHKLAGIDQLEQVLIESTNPNDIIVSDSAQKILNIDLINRGFNIMPAVKGQGSVLQGIDLIQSYEICPDPSSHNLIMELENYVWGDNVRGNPEKEYDNAMDAFRYPVATQLVHGDLV